MAAAPPRRPAAAAVPLPPLPVVPPPPPIQYKGTPFYSVVTPVPFTSEIEGSTSVDVPLVTLPPGTLLFRGIRIPDVEKGEDPRRFFSEYLGAPEGPTMCLTPYHNTFFYPFPYVAFGAHDIGATYNAVQIYVTTRPLNIISSISPSPWYRGITKTKEATTSSSFPLARCGEMAEWCHELSFKESEALMYDNCIRPEYAQKTGVRGWTAIADLDSLKPYKLRNSSATQSPMSSYLLALGRRNPGMTEEMMTHLYVDARKHTGYPEIALYPLHKHQGESLVKRPAIDERAAAKHLEKLVQANNVNFMPLATITEDGIADMVNGHYALREVPGVPEYAMNPTKSTLFPALAASSVLKIPAIERHLTAWLESAKNEGLTLPHYGNGSLSFDMRTGFYVLPQMVPKDLRVRGETPADAPTYNSLLIRLNTEELRKRALEYAVLFRTFLPHMYMKKFPLAKGFGVPRAMIFSRPGFFKRWFEELGISPIPKMLDDLGKRASYQFEVNTGRRNAKKAAEAAAEAEAPMYQPAEAGPKTPPNYSAAANATTDVAPSTPPYNAGLSTTPPPPTGGRRKTRKHKHNHKNKAVHRQVKTRRAAQQSAMLGGYRRINAAQGNLLSQFAKDFKNVWKKIGHTNK